MLWGVLHRALIFCWRISRSGFEFPPLSALHASLPHAAPHNTCIMSSRVPVLSSASPSRRHRYVKALPTTYSPEIPAQEDRDVREIVSDLETAVSGAKLNFALGGRAIARAVSVFTGGFAASSIEYRLPRDCTLIVAAPRPSRQATLQRRCMGYHCDAWLEAGVLSSCRIQAPNEVVHVSDQHTGGPQSCA